MTSSSVTSIKAPKPVRPASPQTIEQRVADAREMVFQAHSIAAVAAAAAVSEMPADEHCTETTLRFLADLLDKVAAMLEPGTLMEASHGDC